MLIGLALAVAHQTPTLASLRTGLAIDRVSRGGRLPVFEDPMLDTIVKTGGLEPGHGWRNADGDKDGWVSVNGGYFYATYDSDRDRSAVLDAAGDSMVYVNGVPRAGDPYAYGWLRLPVALHKGKNTFLFNVGRGRVKADLEPARASAQIQTEDATLPDEIVGETQDLFGAAAVLNNSAMSRQGLRIRAESGGHTVWTSVPNIPPYSLRKVRFDFAPSATDRKVALSLYEGGKPLDQGSVDTRLRKPTEQYKRTFVSQIDGSVQYYAVCPALRPSESNSLVITLHGASVEAIGQAQAYAPKDWCWIVAPTNRRPYGFDWEDWGRMDALEVMGIAKKTLPHHPLRVYLTGHSMGGHGTWAVGTLYPGDFAVIAPSAGWVSFWTYAGGWEPRDPTPAEQALRASMGGSDTMARIKNLGQLAVYILHGDADDNVPVEQARAMRDALKPWHPDFHYYERPGAGHWWGNECVDWPGIFDLFATRQLPADPPQIDFVTPDPSISAQDRWVTIEQQEQSGQMSGVHVHRDGSMIVGTTENVSALSLATNATTAQIDGDRVRLSGKPARIYRAGGHWTSDAPDGPLQKSPDLGGPFKLAFQNHFALVYGTAGNADENAWSFARARSDAETWYYRGNGAVDVLSDVEAARDGLSGRNVVLYGNADTNRFWSELPASCPIRVDRRGVTMNGRHVGATNSAMLFCYPRNNRSMVAVVAGDTLAGARLTDRLPVFVSGVGYPDWTLFGPDSYALGTKGVEAAGYFDKAWQLAAPASGTAKT